MFMVGYYLCLVPLPQMYWCLLVIPPNPDGYDERYRPMDEESSISDDTEYPDPSMSTYKEIIWACPAMY